MKKYNILMVHNYYQIPGGEDSVFKNEKELLESNGHKVITYTRHNNEINKMNFFQKLLLVFITIFNFKTYFDIKKIIKKENIDIVHVHNTLPLISPAVFYAAKKMKVPVVQTIHNFRMICPNGTLYRNNHICEDCINKGLKCAVKNKCYRNSELQTLLLVISMKIHKMTGIYKYVNYICLTEFNKEKILSNKQISEEKVFIKPNFVEKKYEFTRKNKLKNKFIFIGRLEENKGIKDLINSWNHSKYELHIYGDGNCREYVVNKSKNNSKIKYYGFMNQKEIFYDLIDSYGLIVSSKWYEGFPMIIAESFCYGIPILTTDIGNHYNIVTAANAGCSFNNNDFSSLKNEIDEFIKNNKNYSENALLYYKKYLSSDENYKVLINIYDSIK